jgi:hypothetical protein
MCGNAPAFFRIAVTRLLDAVYELSIGSALTPSEVTKSAASAVCFVSQQMPLFGRCDVTQCRAKLSTDHSLKVFAARASAESIMQKRAVTQNATRLGG